MKKLLLVITLLSLSHCATPNKHITPQVQYRVFCATSSGAEMISGVFSHVEILDGGAFLLVSPRGHRVLVNGFCLAAEIK